MITPQLAMKGMHALILSAVARVNLSLACYSALKVNRCSQLHALLSSLAH